MARRGSDLAATERLRGNADGLAEALQGFVRAAPGATAARQELGEALLAAKRPAEAVAVYDEVLAGGGGDAVAHFNRGVAHHHLGGCAAAVDDYLDAAAFPGPPGPAVAAAAACLRELGRTDEAAALEKTGKVANRGTRR